MKTYTLHVAGLTRELPICAVSDTLDIAAFIMLGDVELTKATAAELLKKSPDFDVLLTAECKGIPLAYEMSALSGKPHVIARKEVKVYTIDPIEVVVNSITTQHVQHLVLGSSTALEQLVEKAGGNIVGRGAVLAEGDAAKRDDIFYLEELPLFFK